MQQPAPCRFLIIIFLRKRQAENKFRSHALGTDNIDIFIMRLDYFPRDGEPQAGALSYPCPGKDPFYRNDPQISFRLSLGMPMPLSFTETNTLFLFSVVSILITESEWENLIALSIRL